MVTRERSCDNPAPQNGGKPCEPKDAKETKTDCDQPCESKQHLSTLSYITFTPKLKHVKMLFS